MRRVRTSLSCPSSSLGVWEARGTLCFPERCAGLWAEASSQPSVRRIRLTAKSVEGRGKDSEPESSLLRKIPEQQDGAEGGEWGWLQHREEREENTDLEM